MISYRISPYAHIIETRLAPESVSYSIIHQLTGETLDLSERVRSFLLSLKLLKRLVLSEDNLQNPDEESLRLRHLVEGKFLIPDDCDPLVSFFGHYAIRPAQNPALGFRDAQGEEWLARTSMEYFLMSPGKAELPQIVEEKMPAATAGIYRLSDGTKTLREICETLQLSPNDRTEPEIREAIEFLAAADRQLIKLTLRREDISDPFSPVNAVPRSQYHSSLWNPQPSADPSDRIIDFHLHGIDDAAREFDWIETTINHAFRFPGEVLGGLDYGSIFCLSTLKPEVLPSLGSSTRLAVLEVGGGTGTFARSFIGQALNQDTIAFERTGLKYHILDLSPTLIESQRTLLSGGPAPVTHFQQDATKLDLPGLTFDLIVANEVVADFPMASVLRTPGKGQTGGMDEPPEKKSPVWSGDGASFIGKYGLPVEDAPDSFLVNAGMFRFIERSWEHLSPGGALVLSEYGGENTYPVQLYNLNHDEYSIHFGHAVACAQRVGFRCRLLSLKEFLGMNDEILMLDGHAEHLLCLNHVLEKSGTSIPYGAISRKDFEIRFGEVVKKMGVVGSSFSPLRSGAHFGPDVSGFMVLIMNKPVEPELFLDSRMRP